MRKGSFLDGHARQLSSISAISPARAEKQNGLAIACVDALPIQNLENPARCRLLALKRRAQTSL
jgi:hypothetical protein